MPTEEASRHAGRERAGDDDQLDDYLERIRTQAGYATVDAVVRGRRRPEQLKSISTHPGPTPRVPDVRARGTHLFAQSPLDCLAAPPWMVPVCTADAATASGTRRT
jgi:hypothetical protein